MALLAVVGFVRPALPAATPPLLEMVAPTNTPRLTVELTDGSRLVGWPTATNRTWTTPYGLLDLPWDLLQTAERTREATNLSLAFRNGDHAEAPVSTNALPLQTVFGEVTLPFALIQRIRVETVSRPGGRGLVAYWSFDDPANPGADDSGRGHDLTVKGAKTILGKSGNGVATGGPGYGNHLRCESQSDLQFTGDFTLALWAYRTTPLYDGDELISKEGEFSLRRYSIPSERFTVTLLAKDGRPLAQLAETASGASLDEWSLIVVSRKGNRLSLQVNDDPAVETTVADGEVGSDKPLFVGAGVAGYPWQGRVDEVAKWDRALSAAELRERFEEAQRKAREARPPAVGLPRFR